MSMLMRNGQAKLLAPNSFVIMVRFLHWHTVPRIMIFFFSSFQKLKYERHYYVFCVVAHLKKKNFIKVIAKPPSNL